MDKISVIMPLYNCEGFFMKAANSVLSQTYKNLELIIINDASTDKSYEKALELAKTDSRVSLINLKENGGVGRARNFGIEKATGRYLAFLDSDDIWSKDKLENQLFFMQKHNADVSFTSYAFMDEKGKIMNKGCVHVQERLNLEQFMKTTQIGMSTVMIDAQKVKEARFREERELSEDSRLWIKLLSKGYSFYGMDKISLLYRVRPNQLSQNKMKMACCTLKRYMMQKNLSVFKRGLCFFEYACNGVAKRQQKNTLDQINRMSGHFVR
ncbi:MAG: glycosyltransferase family 2 protein [Alphaproteobacteria bacterium]|nr:glycosyltransferase family 2 protein [Alphaproteobacteria bacterium]